MVLLTSASLFVRSLQARQDTDPGFGHEPTAIVTVNLRSPASPQEGRIALQDIVDRVSAIPGVGAVGLTDDLHLDPMRVRTLDVNVDGVDPPSGQSAHEIDQCVVSPGFFGAMGIPLVRGRNFDASDAPGEQRVVIINAVMAARFWPGEDPLGRVLHTDYGLEHVVVWVARSAKVRTLGEPPRPFIYTPLSQNYPVFVHVLAQASGPADRLLPQMVQITRAVDPDAVVVDALTMEEHLGMMLLPDRLGAFFSSGFSLMSLILATIGLYGVVSYTVASRHREMGIRLSLGADIRRIIGTVVGGGMKLVGVGVSIGLVLALLVNRLLQNLLFGVPVLDPVAFMGMPALLLCVGALAAYIPARRASRVDPVQTLKSE
jgi:predicted permease